MRISRFAVILLLSASSVGLAQSAISTPAQKANPNMAPGASTMRRWT